MNYSIDFCRHVFKIKERYFLTFRQTSERFGVPIRTLFKWMDRIEPKYHRNKLATGIDTEDLKNMSRTTLTAISVNGQHTLA